MIRAVKNRETFLNDLAAYYREHDRHDLPWRMPEADGLFNAYKILVSEIMLQQTQVTRVIPKYTAFLKQFPTLEVLSQASLGDVLVAWQGLGYNRRAKYLWQAAGMATDAYGGKLPRDQLKLERLPGVGRNTAGAVMAYAFNEPALFIETNIRTVYIHHFFPDQINVPDSAIFELLDLTLDRANPREFYWALMDYGSYLKQTVGNKSRSSKTYAKQSIFHGSLRQIRGQVLRLLAAGPLTKTQLQEAIGDGRITAVLESLSREGLIVMVDNHYRLP